MRLDDADEFFEESDKRNVVAAIANIRALDPAVGSGAFPMGILQTLTLALRRLDPRNALWEEFQKERAKARAGEAFDTRDQRQRDDALRDISHTFEKYRQSDFGRKLYLIQNSIYGVDIQPIACQIAKLRFFISLVIEQDPDPGASNLGIKPLPNLETRFVAADTLIGLQAETASLLLDDAVKSKRVKVAAVRERYFLADSRPTKLDCIATEQRLRLELQDMLEDERRTWIAAQERDIESTAKALPNRTSGRHSGGRASQAGLAAAHLRCRARRPPARSRHGTPMTRMRAPAGSRLSICSAYKAALTWCLAIRLTSSCRKMEGYLESVTRTRATKPSHAPATSTSSSTNAAVDC